MDCINKKACVFFTGVFLLCMGCTGQQTKIKPTSRVTVNDSVERKIKDIRSEFNRINSEDTKYKIVKKELNGESTEGGEAKKYYSGDTLRKAILTFYGETGKSTSEYYFKNGQLIFVYDKYDQYQKPIYKGKPSINKVDENRFYFYDNELIRWLSKDGKIVDSSLYKAKEKEILEGLTDVR